MKAAAGEAEAEAEPEPEPEAATVGAKATRREIFAYLLLFFRSVVQLISAPVARQCEYTHSEAE